MSDFDLKISNGTVANSAETFSADIGVKDGQIVAIGKKTWGCESWREQFSVKVRLLQYFLPFTKVHPQKVRYE
jgi:urease alpha subunit|tara:strand:- start:811 stop:1029 length:219 start_codon:yes stop_codon:yes gene_type:complete